MRTAIICGAFVALSITAASAQQSLFSANSVLPGCKAVFEEGRGLGRQDTGYCVGAINPGDSGTLENRVFIKEGGKEHCNGGADDGWHFGWSSQYEPDRAVNTRTVGSYANYSWPGSLPSINGSGYSYYCGTLPECNDPICPE